jgi:hypothetical protein
MDSKELTDKDILDLDINELEREITDLDEIINDLNTKNQSDKNNKKISMFKFIRKKYNYELMDLKVLRSLY